MHQIYYILIFNYYFSDSKENIDTDIDIHGIWQCMKRINSNLDYLAQKFNVEQSDGVQGQAQKPSSSTLDDFDFSSLFPLNEMGDVVSLESKLMDEKSNFYKSFVSFFFLLFIYIPSCCLAVYTKCWLKAAQNVATVRGILYFFVT